MPARRGASRDDVAVISRIITGTPALAYLRAEPAVERAVARERARGRPEAASLDVVAPEDERATTPDDERATTPDRRAGDDAGQTGRRRRRTVGDGRRSIASERRGDGRGGRGTGGEFNLVPQSALRLY
jgi:hypothetical protein